ncbi:hypothetical protein MSG28_002278 [Choristoneura fumiferana]|uniref:Uncharacterized protein n=1 Tax=Choristoneura fumiferana TaxID=7141 RepID=A0ACC0JUZ8_CHOFU|nr:hypothetical protein MSG28_002278 [Choristoneura fumiferana]
MEDLDGKDLVNNNKEVSFDKPFTPHLLSPSQTRPVLKMYSRNRDKNNSANSFTSTRHNVPNFAKPCLPAVTEEINYSSDAVQSSECRKRLKRPSVDKPHLSPKRILRSSSVLHSDSEVTHNESKALTKKEQTTHLNERLLDYGDLDMFDESPVKEKQNSASGIATSKCGVPNSRRAEHPKFGILCACLDKYGGKSQKSTAPKVSDNVVNAVCKKLEDDIAEIQKLSPKDTKQAMDKLVQDLQSRKESTIFIGIDEVLEGSCKEDRAIQQSVCATGTAHDKGRTDTHLYSVTAENLLV